MDDRLYQIEQQKQAALNQSNETYNRLLEDNQALYDQQKAYANQQEQIQNEVLDKQLANQRQEIDRQKEVARQNYQAENKRAKNDYTSFINPYGVEAERQAQSGLANSGYSETTKLGGFNTYQNRLASANKVMQDAFTQYDSDMNKAILENDVQKAQNALNKLQMQLQYSENFYNNKSTLSQNQLTNAQGLDSDYFNRYEQVYGDIQSEKAAQEAIRQWEAEMAEKQRQYNENLAYQKELDARNYAYQQEQDRIAQEQWEKEYALALANQKKNSSGGSGGGSGSKSGSKNGVNLTQQTTPTLSDKANSVLKQLKSLTSVSVNAKANKAMANEILATAQETGTLTKAEADYIFSQIN